MERRRPWTNHNHWLPNPSTLRGLTNNENENNDLDPMYYEPDILAYLFKREMLYICNVHERRRGVRQKVVDWLVVLQESVNLEQEALHRAVSAMDRSLKIPECEGPYTLFGLAALRLAAKYHSRRKDSKIMQICPWNFTMHDISSAETVILESINFDLGSVTAVEFLLLLKRRIRLRGPDLAWSKYIIDLALLERSLSAVRPSLVASSAIFISLCLSQCFVHPRLWTPFHSAATTYSFHDFSSLLPILTRIIFDSSASPALRQKYSHSKFFRVSRQFFRKSEILLQLLDVSRGI